MAILQKLKSKEMRIGYGTVMGRPFHQGNGSVSL